MQWADYYCCSNKQHPKLGYPIYVQANLRTIMTHKWLVRRVCVVYNIHLPHCFEIYTWRLVWTRRFVFSMNSLQAADVSNSCHILFSNWVHVSDAPTPIAPTISSCAMSQIKITSCIINIRVAISSISVITNAVKAGKWWSIILPN